MRFLVQGLFTMIVLFILAIYIAQAPVTDTADATNAKTPTLNLLDLTY